MRSEATKDQPSNHNTDADGSGPSPRPFALGGPGDARTERWSNDPSLRKPGSVIVRVIGEHIHASESTICRKLLTFTMSWLYPS